MEIVLTKSDFLDYRHCTKSLWLKKRKPSAIAWLASSLFDRMLMRDGYRVEEEVKNLVTGWEDGSSCEFQGIASAFNDGLPVRAFRLASR